MKILKIENNKGYFLCSDSNEWNQIDQIDKSGMMKLLNYYLNNDVEMDEYKEEDIGNQAQQIIYKSIYNKMNDLNSNKNKFKDESERKYLDKMQKYKMLT
jgi:hypothetical protein